MLRRPLTLHEKVYARFTRRAQSQCWWWEGSFKEGRPALNLRHVTRYIYEQEIAPIPPGMGLMRTDHRPDCKPHTICIHYRCVNPYHFRLIANRRGIYEREVNNDLGSTEHIARYKSRTVANRRKKEHADDTDEAGPEDQKGLAPE